MPLKPDGHVLALGSEDTALAQLRGLGLARLGASVPSSLKMGTRMTGSQNREE